MIVSVKRPQRTAAAKPSPIKRASPSKVSKKSSSSKKVKVYEIQAIQGHKTIKGALHFLVNWVGYEDKDNTWLPKSGLSSAQSMLQEYMKFHKLDKTTKSPKKQEEYEVEKIAEHKMKNNRPYYLVKWVGYEDKDNTWQAESSLQNAVEILAEYKEKHKLV
jgi:hypothetical protein